MGEFKRRKEQKGIRKRRDLNGIFAASG